MHNYKFKSGVSSTTRNSDYYSYSKPDASEKDAAREREEKGT
jgi:hypothetical protein